MGLTSTGLTYDLATSAAFAGSPTVCFNLPSITNSTAFNNLQIRHLENNVWIDRTNSASVNFATKTICTSNLTSLSPFAILNGLAPLAANAAISGRVTTAAGNAIGNAVISITNSSGETFTTRTGAFGYYRFEDLPVGASYILSISAKRFTFVNPTRVINLNEDLADENFMTEGK